MTKHHRYSSGSAIGVALGWMLVSSVAGAGDKSEKAVAEKASAGSPPAAVAPPSDSQKAIVSVNPTKNGRALRVTRQDGSRFDIKAGKVSWGDDRVFLHVMDTSANKQWAIVECSTEEEGGGSLAGSVSTAIVLVSIQHRRLIEPEKIGLERDAYFLSFERKGDVEVVTYTGTRNGKEGEYSASLSDLERRLAK